MRRLLALLCLLALAACADAMPVDLAYTGPDAGMLVISMTLPENPPFNAFDLDMRREHEDSYRRFNWAAKGPFSRSPDVQSGFRQALVFVKALRPGRYEFFSFNAFVNGGMVTTDTHPRHPFAIPFTIEAGKTTYLGELDVLNFIYLGPPALARGEGAGRFFADRASRDIPIARAKTPLIGPVRVTPPGVQTK